MSERIFRRDWKFIVGTTLCLLNSFVIGAIHVGVLYLFGLPLILLAVGIALLLGSNASGKAKAMIAGATVALVPVTFATSFYLSSAEPETFLIPNGYRGEIVVFLDEQCGSDPVYENGRRIYIIGYDGILITKFPKNRGYLDRKFYYVDESGDHSQFPAFQRQDFQTEREEWEMWGHSGPVESFSKDTVGAFWAYGTETYFISRNSIGYRIWSYNDLERDSKVTWSESKQFVENAKLVLNSCREIGTR